MCLFSSCTFLFYFFKSNLGTNSKACIKIVKIIKLRYRNIIIIDLYRDIVNHALKLQTLRKLGKEKDKTPPIGKENHQSFANCTFL